MEDLKCPVCQGEVKLIPAGVSKRTGKSYDAFYGCETYGCKGTIKIGAEGTPSAKSYATAQKSVNREVSDNINRFESKKEESMKVMASGRDAVLIVTSEMNQGAAWTDDQVKAKIIEWKEFMYKNIYDAPAGIN